MPNLSVEDLAEAGCVGVYVIVDDIVPLYLLQQTALLGQQLRVLLDDVHVQV